MKKISTIICAILVLCFVLSSCSEVNTGGKSVIISKVFTFNNPLSILNYNEAYTENITYYKQDKTEYSYSIYISEGEKSGTNDVCEKHPNTTFYAYNGTLYSYEDGELYTLIQPFGTYNEVVLKYIETRSNDFDDLTNYQKYSKEYNENGKRIIETAYIARTTPTIAAKYNELGIEIGDDILIVYKIDKSTNLFDSISYYYVRNNTNTLFMVRDYSYHASKLDMFSSLPTTDEMINLSIVYSPNTETETKADFSIQKGTKLGIDTFDKKVSFFTDIECKSPFDYKTYELKEGSIIYGIYDETK